MVCVPIIFEKFLTKSQDYVKIPIKFTGIAHQNNAELVFFPVLILKIKKVFNLIS